MAETKESEETTRARSQTAEAEAQAQAAPRQLSQDVTVQHPDTKEWWTGSRGEEVPDWALTVLGANMFTPAAEPPEEIRLGPVPGFGQGVPNRLIGEDGEGESLSEAKAEEQFIPAGVGTPYIETNVRDAAGDTASSTPVPQSESDEEEPKSSAGSTRRRRSNQESESAPTPPSE